jgi:hypothetical protein
LAIYVSLGFNQAAIFQFDCHLRTHCHLFICFG